MHNNRPTHGAARRTAGALFMEFWNLLRGVSVISVRLSRPLTGLLDGFLANSREIPFGPYGAITGTVGSLPAVQARKFGQNRLKLIAQPSGWNRGLQVRGILTTDQKYGASRVVLKARLTWGSRALSAIVLAFSCLVILAGIAGTGTVRTRLSLIAAAILVGPVSLALLIAVGIQHASLQT